MRIQTAVILFLAMAPTAICRAQQAPSLTADEVVAKVIDHNIQRDTSAGGYTGSRRYVLENHRMNKRAEMLVNVKCGPDGMKHFEVASEQGWGSANKRVLRKMLESESETSRPQIRPITSLTPENYRFQMLGNDSVDARPVYLIHVVPKREDKYLFDGKVWIDAEDFAVVRVEGKPAKNPSFWTRSVHFVQRYQKSGDFWFPASTESITEARIFGMTDVTITYFDYQPNSATAPLVSKNAPIDRNEETHAQH